MKVATIGAATLYCGDCLEILPDLTGIDALITDPPYSSGGQFRGDRTSSTRDKYQTSAVLQVYTSFAGDNRDQRSWSYWVSLWLGVALKATKPGAIACLFSDWRQLPSLSDAVQSGGWVWRGIAVWNKISARPVPNRFTAQTEFILWATNGPRSTDTDGATYHKGLFSFSSPPTATREHSTQKPVELMEYLCEVVPVGGVVLDPFMGSGTTGVACARLGRKFVGIELQPEYFDIACDRIRAAQEEGALFAPEETAPQQESLL